MTEPPHEDDENSVKPLGWGASAAVILGLSAMLWWGVFALARWLGLL